MQLQRGTRIFYDFAHSTKVAEAGHISELATTKDNPYLVPTGELWGVYCQILEKIDRVITASHCTNETTYIYVAWTSELYLRIDINYTRPWWISYERKYDTILKYQSLKKSIICLNSYDSHCSRYIALTRGWKLILYLTLLKTVTNYKS